MRGGGTFSHLCFIPYRTALLSSADPAFNYNDAPLRLRRDRMPGEGADVIRLISQVTAKILVIGQPLRKELGGETVGRRVSFNQACPGALSGSASRASRFPGGRFGGTHGR